MNLSNAVSAVVTGVRGWKPSRTSEFAPEVNLTCNPTYTFQRWFWNGNHLVKDGTVTVSASLQNNQDEEDFRRRQDEDDRALRELLGLE